MSDRLLVGIIARLFNLMVVIPTRLSTETAVLLIAALGSRGGP